MTTYYPISFSPQQYHDSNDDLASGYVLKFYSAGTSTPINIYTDYTGGTSVGTVTLNASGYPTVSGNVIIPHLAENYKIALYATQTAADANTGAVWTVDNVQIAQNANAARFIAFAADTGSVNAYVIDPDPPITAYAAGQVVTLKPGNSNTGASTLAINGLTAKNIKLPDPPNHPNLKALYPFAMKLGGIYELTYDGTQFILENPENPYTSEEALASATTTDLGTKSSQNIRITGTTTITGFGSSASAASPVYFLRFTGALTLTHNATSLILPGGASITTAAGDTCVAEYEGSGNWRVRDYTKATGKAVITSVTSTDLPSGVLLQSVSGTYTSNADLSTTIPKDDTIPQNTEGTEIVSVSITPSNTSNVLEITFTGLFSAGSAATNVYAALFQDSTANALQVSAGCVGAADDGGVLTLTYRMTAGTTSSTTFKIRVGGESGTVRMNGTTAARLFGGAAASYIIVREYKA